MTKKELAERLLTQTTSLIKGREVVWGKYIEDFIYLCKVSAKNPPYKYSSISTDKHGWMDRFFEERSYGELFRDILHNLNIVERSKKMGEKIDYSQLDVQKFKKFSNLLAVMVTPPTKKEAIEQAEKNVNF